MSPKRQKKRTKEDRERAKVLRQQEIDGLNTRIEAEAPDRGYAPPNTQIVAFRALPISDLTLRGLDGAKPTPYSTMTAIQNACIPHALAGRDVMGAAKTGSGKTLAYLIPVLEALYRNAFVPADGPGAIILSPTRELAVQIFQVLKQAGKYHTFSVGLLIGGKKDFYDEQQQIATTNLLIATPGRLLQHCEQTPYLDLSMVRILVLDEADRILDMGFRDQLVRILDYLPSSDRQTMLFSATQTRDVSHLATLSMNKPEYMGVHDKEKNSTPEGLQQSYVVVPLKDKLNAVFSFLKSNLKCKSILFFASCAQVQHAYELFCSLRPGISVLCLHGKLSQTKRTQIYFDFLQRPHAVLIATDICARGLDFPNVDWVVQADAPEDRDMYVHRAGRTARFRSGGKALLMLTPKEESNGFIDLLQQKKSTGKRTSDAKDTEDVTQKNMQASQIPLKKLHINPTKAVVVSQRAASLVASNPMLNQLAKKAFRSYVRSIHLMPHKNVFGVKDLDIEGFASSLGLAATPNLQFIKNVSDREENRQSKNVNRKLQKLKEQIKADKLAKRIAKLKSSDKSQYLEQQATEADEDADDELLVSKKSSNHDADNDSDSQEEVDVKLHESSQSRHPKKIRIEGSNSAENRRVVFDDEGEEQDVKGLLEVDQAAVQKVIGQDRNDLARATDDYMDKVRQRLQATSAQDEKDAKQRIREKHRKRRLQDKSEKDDVSEDVDAPVAVLENVDLEDDPSSSSSSDDEEDEQVDTKTQEEMALALIRGAA